MWSATPIESLRRITRPAAMEDGQESARAAQKFPRGADRRLKDPARAEDTTDIEGGRKVRQASAEARKDRPRLEITTRPEPRSSPPFERHDGSPAHDNRAEGPIGDGEGTLYAVRAGAMEHRTWR